MIKPKQPEWEYDHSELSTHAQSLIFHPLASTPPTYYDLKELVSGHLGSANNLSVQQTSKGHLRQSYPVAVCSHRGVTIAVCLRRRRESTMRWPSLAASSGLLPSPSWWSGGRRLSAWRLECLPRSASAFSFILATGAPSLFYIINVSPLCRLSVWRC